MTKTFDDFPLRTQKRARTRVALVEALLPMLAERTLEEIQVSELADTAGISQATFFNYFPTKGDLLTHFIQLWSLRVDAQARRIRTEHKSALAALEALFVSTAEQSAGTPRVMLELIAHQARMPPGLTPPTIEEAERALFLPGEADVMSLSDRGLGGVMPQLIAEACAAGELPADADVMTLTMGAASIFFGVPLILGQQQHPVPLAAFYRRQLSLLWDGARAQGVSRKEDS
jgi:AcrR family transcriptional regulator